TYKNQYGNQGLAWASFLIPSIYQWSTDQMATAIAMDIAYLTAWSITLFALEGKEKVQYGVPFIVAVHLWSGIDGILSTQWDSNPDARNFSWGILPTGKDSFAAAAMFRF
ncbi:MAG: hypothetical protein FWH22_08285, partial [Fibromonadales bacterium]|nr:hypothetical protein [Fibromonadales bacterium]